MVGIVVAGEEDILIDPADASCVGAELGLDAFGQAVFNEIEIFQHATAGPVEIGSIFENDIDEGLLEHADAAHDLGVGDAHHGGGQGVGDLILDDIGGLPRVVGGDDDLDIRQIGHGIEADVDGRPDTSGHEHGGEEQHHELIADGDFDDFGNHGGTVRFWVTS